MNKNKGRKTGSWDRNSKQYLNWLKARHPEKYAQLMAVRGIGAKSNEIIAKNINSEPSIDPIEVPKAG